MMFGQEMIDNIMEKSRHQAEEMSAKRVLVRLKATIKGNEVEIRTNNMSVAVPVFEALKKECINKLTEGTQ